MRWYDVMLWGNTVENPYVSKADNLFGISDELLGQGQVIKDWNTASWIRCTEPEWDGIPDDVLQSHLGVPIYSKRLQEAIERAGFSGIQFLPLHVLRVDGTEIPGFAVANILNTPSSMDLEHSEYRRFPEDYFAPADRGKVASVYKMILKRESLGGYDIIRPKEYHVAVYASERFKEMFQKGSFTGYSFEEVALS